MKKVLITLSCAIILLASLSVCSYAADRHEDKTFDISYTTDLNSGCVTAAVEAVNTSALPQNATIIVGMYDSDGNMHSVSCKKYEVPAASKLLLTSEPTEKKDALHTPRTFVWDSSLKPLEHGGELHTVRKNAFISAISINGEKAYADNNSCIIWVSEQTDLQSITVSSINLPQGASYSADESNGVLTVISEDGSKSVTYTLAQTDLTVMDFENGTPDAKPDGWSISGNSNTSALVKSDGKNMFFCLDDRSTQNGKIGTVCNLTNKLSAPYTVSYKIKYERAVYESGVNDASSCWFHLRDSSNNTVMSASVKDYGAYLDYNAKSANGEKSAGARMKPGIWHEIKMTCVSENEALFYLDGELVYSASPLVLADLAKLSIFTTDARICTMYIDDIAIYSDSYAAELKAAYEDIESQFSGVLPWLASLYDPHTGGFYTTVSGRDGADFVPSLESTAFVYAMMTNSETGLLSTMPDEFKASLISYFQNAQSDEDGFFYDYGVSPGDYGDRAKMRVYQQCVNKLSALGAEPLYTLPSERLTQMASLMAQTDAITIPSGFPAYLATVDEFIAMVESRSWDTNSWTAGDLTYEDTSYLIQLGEEVYAPYIDALFTWLENRQDGSTGYWAQAGDNNFNALSGAFKVVRIYDRFGVMPPNSDKICKSIIQTLFSGETPSSACDIRNFLDILSIIKKYDADLVSNTLKGNELSIVRAYAGYMKIFFKPDGGASVKQNTSTSTFGGIPSGEKLSEGDIDGTQQMFLARYYLRRLFGRSIDNSAFAEQYDAFWTEIENKKPKNILISFEDYAADKTPIATNSDLWVLADDADEYHTRIAEENTNKLIVLTDNSAETKTNARTANVLSCTAPFKMSFDVRYELPEGVTERTSEYDFSYSPFYVRNGTSTTLCGVQPVYKNGKFYFCLFENGQANTAVDMEITPGQWYNVRMYYYRSTDGNFCTDYTFTDSDGYSKTYEGILSGAVSKKATTYYFSTSSSRKCRVSFDNLHIEEVKVV